MIPRSRNRWLGKTPVLALVLAAALLVNIGCDGGSDSGDSRPVVVATTTQVADLVANVGGKRLEVHGLLGPNADPHGYEPRPSDVSAVSGAAAVFRSGGDVDEWLGDVVENAGGSAETVTLIGSVQTRVDGDEVDPHWWHDPRNAIRAVAAIREALVRVDPGGRRTYEHNAEAYAERIRALDRRIAGCLERLPPAERRVVTTHDALGYLARRYDVRIVGTVIPSLSSQAQASARGVERLVSQIERERVGAIFPEAELSSDLERAIADEAGVEVGDPLWTDSLGPEGSDGATYLSALAANADALTRGMSDGRVTCTH